MKLKCKCSYEWNYKGKHKQGKFYVTCPSCYNKVRVDLQ